MRTHWFLPLIVGCGEPEQLSGPEPLPETVPLVHLAPDGIQPRGVPVFRRESTSIEVHQASPEMGPGPSEGRAAAVSLSHDGRMVAYASDGKNGTGDTNDVPDIFVRDGASGLTLAASMDYRGQFGVDLSNEPHMSGDGRFVIFHSSSQLAEQPTGGFQQLYLRDLDAGRIVMISKFADGEYFRDAIAGSDVSFDGAMLAFSTNVFRPIGSGRQWDLHIFDRRTKEFKPGALTPSGEVPNRGSRWPRFSANGRYLAFVSDASDIVEGDTNGVDDIFLRDLESGLTERISSPGPGGNDRSSTLLRPAVSADGSVVAFATWSTLLPEDRYATADVYVRDRTTGSLEVIELLCGTPPSAVEISGDGRFVLIASSSDAVVLDQPQATNGATYPLLFDRASKTLTRLHADLIGGVSSVALSGDGLHVAYTTDADPARVFVD